MVINLARAKSAHVDLGPSFPAFTKLISSGCALIFWQLSDNITGTTRPFEKASIKHKWKALRNHLVFTVGLSLNCHKYISVSKVKF